MIFSSVLRSEEGAVSDVKEFFISIRYDKSIFDNSDASGVRPSLEMYVE